MCYTKHCDEHRRVNEHVITVYMYIHNMYMCSIQRRARRLHAEVESHRIALAYEKQPRQILNSDYFQHTLPYTLGYNTIIKVKLKQRYLATQL